jgi:hypothetical protein
MVKGIFKLKLLFGDLVVGLTTKIMRTFCFCLSASLCKKTGVKGLFFCHKGFKISNSKQA